MNLNLDEKLGIVRRHQQNGLPVKVVPIAKDLGLKVYYATNFSDEISGLIKQDKTAPNGYGIFVNKNHAPTRRRFTIAHEIAHYVLHEDKIGDGISDDMLYRSNLSNRIEAQANQLAADILMPWSLLSDELNPPEASVSSLSKKFEVSESAMSIRLGVPFEYKKVVPA